MTQEEAVAKLKLRCAWDKTPALTEDDLEDLISDAILPDSSGRIPTDTGYVGTYDLNQAAQRAWERKAGLAASCVDFTSDGEKWDRSQIMEHCMSMADSFARKRVASFGRTDAQGRSLALLPWQIGNGPCCCD